LDGDDYIGDECKDAVEGITALSYYSPYLYWAITDNDSAGIWRKKTSS
jgi:hypothetical protein